MTRPSMVGLVASLAIVLGRATEAPAQGQGPPSAGGVLARTITLVVDDFVVDIYHNGVRVPDDRRELVVEVFGATVERVKLDVRPGDWLVFNAVNNRLRWGGASYFAASARGDAGVAFTTELDSGRWSCCDDPAQVAQFIADPDRFADHRALPITNRWSDGDAMIAKYADGWAGQPLWGGSRNTWIKYRAR